MDSAASITSALPVRLWDVARVVGVSRQRLEELVAQGRLPAPNRTIGGAKAWDAATAERIIRDRIAAKVR